MDKKILYGILSVFLLAVFMIGYANAASPSGASVTPVTNTTSDFTSVSPESHAAIAGNITAINLTGSSTTQAWSGYYGNVSGEIKLADSSGNSMYNWTSDATVPGEVFASNISSVTWTNIQCFNFTANGSVSLDETGTKGATSLTGMNLTMLESYYNIASNDGDGIDQTFGLNGSLTNNNGNHDEIIVNSLNFSSGECLSANVFSSGTGTDDQYEEVLLYDPDNDVPIWTAIIETSDIAGFDTNFHDFQLLVPEDGHSGDTNPTIYYFYVELG